MDIYHTSFMFNVSSKQGLCNRSAPPKQNKYLAPCADPMDGLWFKTSKSSIFLTLQRKLEPLY